MYLDGLRPCWDGLSRVTGEKFSSLFFRIGLFKNFHKKYSLHTSYLSDTESIEYQAGSTPFLTGSHRITIFSHRVRWVQHLFPPGQAGSTPVSFRVNYFVFFCCRINSVSIPYGFFRMSEVGHIIPSCLVQKIFLNL